MINGESSKLSVDEHMEAFKTMWMKGAKLALKKLVDRKIKEDSYLIFWVDGKATQVMAKDIKLNTTSE